MDTIQLAYNASEKKVIGKDITSIGSPINCIIKGNAGIMNPVFILNSGSSYPVGVNYLYWQDTGRYYFIDDIQILTGNRVAIYCTVDVLESFKTYIKNQSAIIDKQEDIANVNLYINDGSFITTEQTSNQIINFSNGFNDNGEFILITAGA